MLSSHVAFSVDRARLLSLNVLEAIQYLHANSVVHRRIRPASVIFDHSGTFKLSDISIVGKLEDLYRYSRDRSKEMVNSSRGCVQVCFDTTICSWSVWYSLSRSIFLVELCCRGKKSDILSFGTLLCSVLLGEVIEHDMEEPPVTLPAEIKDFLFKICCCNDKHRWSADQLLQHPFLLHHQTADNQPYIPPTEVQRGLSRLRCLFSVTVFSAWSLHCRLFPRSSG